MDTFPQGDSVIRISGGQIRDISMENTSIFVTITYTDCVRCRQSQQTVRLVVSHRTRIFDENGRLIPASELRTGMIVDASFSSAMTRSIPPQSAAFLIRIVSRPLSDSVTTGRIMEIDRRNRNLTTIRDGNLSSVIRFHVPENTPIFDQTGRTVPFSRLVSGLRVRIRHASFMTASIPPQTTAFEIRIL